MRLEIWGILTLTTVFFGYIFMFPPEIQCEPVETVHYVKSEPEIIIKEVEHKTVCVKEEAVVEPESKRPRHRWRRRH